MGVKKFIGYGILVVGSELRVAGWYWQLATRHWPLATVI